MNPNNLDISSVDSRSIDFINHIRVSIGNTLEQ